jgi:hypothetical protein
MANSLRESTKECRIAWMDLKSQVEDRNKKLRTFEEDTLAKIPPPTDCDDGYRVDKAQEDTNDFSKSELNKTVIECEKIARTEIQTSLGESRILQLFLASWFSKHRRIECRGKGN